MVGVYKFGNTESSVWYSFTKSIFSSDLWDQPVQHSCNAEWLDENEEHKLKTSYNTRH